MLLILYKFYKMYRSTDPDQSFNKFGKILLGFFFAFFMGGCSESLTSLSQTVENQSSSADTKREDQNNPPEAPNQNHDELTRPGTKGSGGTTGRKSLTYNSRKYIAYVPSSYNENQPIPIVVAMHGLGDDYVNFYDILNFTGWVRLAEQESFILMVPDHTNTQRKSFLHFNGNSFDENSTKNEINSLLEAVYYGVGGNYNISLHEIFWIGFSEGASFSSYSGLVLYNELKAVVPYGGASPPPNNSIPRKIPIRFVTGQSDFSYDTIKDYADLWKNNQHITETDFVSAGHSFVDLNALVPPRLIWQWLSVEINQQQAPEVIDSF